SCWGRASSSAFSSLCTPIAMRQFGSSVLDSRQGRNDGIMKAPDSRRRRGDADDMRPEYDFSRGIRGKYAERFAHASNVVVLDPDIAAEFRTARDVNKALRGLLTE